MKRKTKKKIKRLKSELNEKCEEIIYLKNSLRMLKADFHRLMISKTKLEDLVLRAQLK